MKLRAISKTSAPVVVRSIPSSILQRDSRPIDAWIQSTKGIRITKKPSIRHLQGIEELMQQWPVEMETFLSRVLITNKNDLFDPSIHLSLQNYVELVCGILDIPIKGRTIESLHLIFTLYHEFSKSDHFKAMNRQ